MNEVKKINIEGDNFEILRWIWKNLVPKSGQADTVQGELLRAVEKLRYEAQDNGNINWDKGFDMFISFILETLTSVREFTDNDKLEIKNILSRLDNFITPDQMESESDIDKLPYVEDDLYDRLSDFIVDYCKINSDITPLEKNLEQYR